MGSWIAELLPKTKNLVWFYFLAVFFLVFENREKISRDQNENREIFGTFSGNFWTKFLEHKKVVFLLFIVFEIPYFAIWEYLGHNKSILSRRRRDF